MTSNRDAALPYCGAPPDPAAIWSQWRLDPVVLGVLLALGFVVLIAFYRERENASGRARLAPALLFASGWLIATLALVSPLCPLSVSLFAARAAQHVILTTLAAPLIAAAHPLRVVLGASPSTRARAQASAPVAPLAAAALFALLIWFWHMPAPYAATFASVALYWAMHLSLFLAALWLWSCLLDAARHAFVGALFAGIGSAIQMGLLGALITLSPRPFYAPHFLTTDAWGLTPLQDQQLGGVIMWVVGGCTFFLVALVGLARGLAERREPTFAAATAIPAPVQQG